MRVLSTDFTEPLVRMRDWKKEKKGGKGVRIKGKKCLASIHNIAQLDVSTNHLILIRLSPAVRWSLMQSYGQSFQSTFLSLRQNKKKCNA